MNDRTPTGRTDVHRRVVIRTLAVLAFGMSLLLAANAPHTSVESATYSATVRCPGIVSSDPEPQIWEIGFVGQPGGPAAHTPLSDEAIPEQALAQACDDATRGSDIGAFLFFLVALGLLPWALFADREGHIRRRTDDAETAPVRTA